jgi:hypothetical protein
MPVQGRPRIKIDWHNFESLCSLHCTEIEIAAFLRCSIDTLERAVKREYRKTFADVYKEKAAAGKTSLRRTMWKKAVEAKDTTLLIWLSKNHLGMSDKNEERIVQEKPTEVNVIWQTRSKDRPTYYDTKSKPESEDEEPAQNMNEPITPFDE